MKSIIGALLVGTALILASVKIQAKETEDCTFIVNPKQPTEFICIKNDQIVDLDRLNKEDIPAEHDNCKGKRSLSKDAQGIVSFSCDLP